MSNLHVIQDLQKRVQEFINAVLLKRTRGPDKNGFEIDLVRNPYLLPLCTVWLMKSSKKWSPRPSS